MKTRELIYTGPGWALMMLLVVVAFAAGVSAGDSEARAKFNWHRIVSDPDYYTGDGRGETRRAAKQAAANDLLASIQVSIGIKFSSRKREVARGGDLAYVDTTTVEGYSYSGLYLQGLDYLVLTGDDGFHALAYISRESFEKSVEQRKGQIREYIVLGTRAEKEARIGDALRCYYWAYLLSLTCPDTLHSTFGGEQSQANPQIGLTSRIKRVIGDIDVRPVDVYRDGDVVIADLRFAYRNKPVEWLEFTYYSGLGTDYRDVRGGRATIPIYDDPAFPERELLLAVDYACEREMTMNKEILSLHRVLGNPDLPNRIPVTLRFDWLLEEKTEEAPQREAEPRAVETEVSKSKPGSHPEQFLILASIREFRDFKRVLVEYKRLDQVQFGTRPQIGGGVGNYVAIVDAEKLWGVFHFDGKKYKEITSGRELETLVSEFRGKRQIWMREP